MTIQKQQVNEIRSLLASSRQVRSATLVRTVFANPEDRKNNLTNEIFDQLLARIFKSFETKDSPHYLEHKWLSIRLKEFLVVNKDSSHYQLFFQMMRIFYARHPFDLELILTTNIRNFLLKYPHLIDLINNGTLTTNDLKLGLDALVETYFLPLFRAFMTENIINNNAFKSLYKIITTILKANITARLKMVDDSYEITNNSRVLQLINSFNYQIAQELGVVSFYNEFFANKTNEQIVNLKLDLFKSNVQQTFNSSLTSDQKSPLLDVVYHYLFADLVSTQEIEAVANEYVYNAKLLIAANNEDHNKNSDESSFQKHLDLFFPNLTNVVKKFGFTYKTNVKTSGLIFQKYNPHPYLTPTDATKNKYAFQFQLSYYTPFLQQASANQDLHFRVLVKEGLPPFVQALNMLKNFKQTVQWNQGYFDSNLWTEKDLVAWINDFQTVRDLINFIRPSSSLAPTSPHPQKLLASNEWHHFSPSNYQALDFALIDAQKTSFSVQPIIEFVRQNPAQKQTLNSLTNDSPAQAQLAETTFYRNEVEQWQHFFGSFRIYLRLTQTFINADGQKKVVRRHNFIIKELSTILSIPELFMNLVQKQFPSFINYEEWINNGNKMWANEFLTSTGSIGFNASATPVLIRRTNAQMVHQYLNQLLQNVNVNYRPDFRLRKTNPFHRGDQLNVIKLLFFDTKIANSGFRIEHILMPKILPAFTKIDTQMFSKKAITNNFFDVLSKKTELIDPKPEILKAQQEIPLQALLEVDGQQKTLQNIFNHYQALGFKNIKSSDVNVRKMIYHYSEKLKDYTITVSFWGSKVPKGKLLESYKWIQILFDVDYFDFTIGQASTKQLSNTITLFWFRSINNNDKPFISPAEMNRDYEKHLEIMNKVAPHNEQLTNNLKDLFAIHKNGDLWKKDVTFEQWNETQKKADALLRAHNLDLELLEQLEKVYNGSIPKDILAKMDDPNYLQMLKEILANSDHLSQKNLQQILQNHKLINFLQSQDNGAIKNVLASYSKVAKSTKYVYLGTGITFAITGVLAGLTSLRSLRLYRQTKQTNLNFKKPKTIARISLLVSIVTLSASAILTLLFFIEKGGF